MTVGLYPPCIARFCLLLIPLLIAACSRAPEAPTIDVFAAASTAGAMQTAADRFESTTGIHVRLNSGASSLLARQIRAGAPVDVFLSANEEWMDEITEAGFARVPTRRVALRNRLVFATRSDAPEIDLREPQPPPGRIAIADPAHVPAGRYAQQALEHLGWWDGVRTRLVTAPDVRAALRLVEIGEAQLGIVYASDVTNRTDMGPIVRIPAEAHAPIRYPIACCSDDANALRFLEFVTGPDCADIFLDAGFAPN